MSGNNSYGPWKSALPLDVIASVASTSTSTPATASSHISMATLTAIPSDLMMGSTGHSSVGPLGHRCPTGGSQAMALQRQSIDVYSQIGMQRLGQLYKANNCSNTGKYNTGERNLDVVKVEQNMSNVQQIVESAIGNDGKQQIMQILEKISLLQPPERLLLYMRMPSSTSETDPLRQPQNPLGTRSEINHTINWVRSHLEHDPNVSIPKQDVYDDYVSYCTREDIKPLSTADFGKVMKQIFPGIRPRRLGTRGNSRYCYAAMRKTTKLDCPFLPNLGEPSGSKASTSKFSDDSVTESDTTSSWKIIKTWAEGLLSTEFDNVKQLAEFISTNYSSSNTIAAVNSSKVLLQKKLLQRKVKGRKKSVAITNPETIMQKKRRKKKLKSQLSLPDTQNGPEQMASELSNTNTLVPDKVLPQKLQIPAEHSPHYRSSKTSHSASNSSAGSQQMLPINLKTNENNNKIKCEQTDLFVGDVSAIDIGQGPVSYDDIDVTNVVCKVEVTDGNEIEQNVYCKKVKRAQESKGLLNTIPSMALIMPPQPHHSQISSKNKTTSSMNNSNTSHLMQPPNYSHMLQFAAVPNQNDGTASGNQTAELGEQAPDGGIASSTPASNKRSTNPFPLRNKKLRYLKNPASLSALNETKVDDVTTDIIIPRERVISICSLDKDALDDYLNEGDNSQEQEAELLQYFQQPPAVAGYADVAKGSNTNAASGTSSTFPILENYQLYNNQQMALQSQRQSIKKQEQINELRQYLQQNLQQSQGSVVGQMGGGPSGGGGNSAQHKDGPTMQNIHAVIHQRGDYQDGGSGGPNTGSAAASLAMLSSGYRNSMAMSMGPSKQQGGVTLTTGSKRKSNAHIDQQSHMQQPQQSNNLVVQQPQPQQQQQQQIHNQHHPPLLRSVSASACANVAALQSPNSRRKHFSFVPISPGPQSPRVFTHQQLSGSGISVGPATNTVTVPSQNIGESSPFVSPRATPGIRKPVTKDLASCITSSLQTSDPLIGSYKTAFSKPNSLKTEISASAPSSPSISQHHFQFNNGAIICGYGSGNNKFSSSGNVLGLNNQTMNIGTLQQPPIMCPPILESRSQSVPLHCQSPAFNHTTATSTAYSSACNSIAQTPVPSEFADFCDENLMNILAETSVEQNIKLEVNEIPDLLDADMGGGGGALDHMLPDHLSMRGHSLNSMSRSVPSTPLPHLNYNNSRCNNKISGGIPAMTISCAAVNKLSFDMSKSVPTTPIALMHHGGCTPFRFSPEHNRDFLINGNTIDLKGNPFLMQQQQAQHILNNNNNNNNNNQSQTGLRSRSLAMISNEMDELSNYSDVNDPIIDGSDLLNEL